MIESNGGAEVPEAGRASRLSCGLEILLLTLIGFVLLWRGPEANWRPYTVPDASEVYYATRHLVEQGTYEIQVHGELHPPRYSYGYTTFFLAPIQRLVGNPKAMFAVPMLCGIANMGLIYLLVRRLYGPWPALIAALLLPGLPSYFIASWDILSHVPSLTLYLLIAVLTPRLGHAGWRGIAAALAIGVLGGVAMTIRPTNVLLLLPPAVVLLFQYLRCPGPLVARGVAMGAAAAAFVVPLLRSNLHTFGTLTRTGYSYWYASIYDVPGNTFRFDLDTIQKTIGYYFFPIGQELDPFHISGLPFLVVLSMMALVMVGLVRAFRGEPARRRYALFALTSFATFQALYLPYVFQFHWFMYPAYACLAPFLASELARCEPGMAGGRRAAWRRSAVLLAVFLLCLGYRWYVPWERYDPRSMVGYQYRQLRQTLPEDVVFISQRNPLGFYEELERETHRTFVPLNRRTEYATARISRRPPPERTAAAVEAASEPVFPVVFLEDPDSFLQQYAGRKLIVETADPGSVSKSLPPEYELKPIQTNPAIQLFEIVRR
jgi:hypothetical protein